MNLMKTNEYNRIKTFFNYFWTFAFIGIDFFFFEWIATFTADLCSIFRHVWCFKCFFLHHLMKYITHSANIVTVCIVPGIFIYCASAFQDCYIFSVRSYWMLENALNCFYCGLSWLNSTDMEECLNRNRLKVWIVRIFIHTQTAATTKLTICRKR